MPDDEPRTDEQLVRDAAHCLGPASRYGRVVAKADALRAAGADVVIRLRPGKIEIVSADAG